jgi:2,5-diketo-D-gluconate reductase A
MAQQPQLTLNDGRDIPQIGFGVWQVPPGEVATAVSRALGAGYRSVDTAAAYNNEEGVGAALAKTPDEGASIFLTTKLWNDRHGYDETLRAFDESLRKLKRDSVDLYLIHWPSPHRGLYVETWRAFIRLREEGRARSIGVSNFTIAHLERLIDETGVVPALNQIELHPRFQQQRLRDFHLRHNIATESWSPLGRGRLFEDPTIVAIAKKYRKTPAQVIIRWHIDNGLIVIPKSITPGRIRENIDVFDFALGPDELSAIERLDESNGRVGPDPDTAVF